MDRPDKDIKRLNTHASMLGMNERREILRYIDHLEAENKRLQFKQAKIKNSLTSHMCSRLCNSPSFELGKLYDLVGIRREDRRGE